MNQLLDNPVVAQLEASRLIAVVRTSKPEQVPFICDALIEAGLRTIELTLTIPQAIEVIRSECRRLGEDACFGAGTVLTSEQCRQVMDAGARFVVSPIGNIELVEIAHGQSVPTMIGAYSPTEAFRAWQAGSDFVKIFPADTLGPKYIKALKAPLKELKVVPTGGVNLENILEFLNAGCAAVGVGSPLIRTTFLDQNDWRSLTELAKAFLFKLNGP